MKANQFIRKTANYLIYFLGISRFSIKPILMYHQVIDKDNYFENESISCKKEDFEKQMLYLKQNFRIVNLNKLIKNIELKEKNKKEIAITFDDGYEDFYKNVLPILKKFDVPATLFISVEKIGKRGFLNLNQIRELNKIKLVDIQSHGLNHVELTGLSYNEIINNIKDSKSILEKMLKRKIEIFSYPFGSSNEQIRGIAKKHYNAAVSISGDYKDKYKLYREGIDISDSFLRFKILASGSNYIFNRLRGLLFE